jgi:hypothetical protein
MNVRYRIELSQAARDELTAMLGGGEHAVRKLKRAQILLAASRLPRRGNCPDSLSPPSAGPPDRAPLRGRQSGAGLERGAASGR